MIEDDEQPVVMAPAGFPAPVSNPVPREIISAWQARDTVFAAQDDGAFDDLEPLLDELVDHRAASAG